MDASFCCIALWFTCPSLHRYYIIEAKKPKPNSQGHTQLSAASWLS